MVGVTYTEDTLPAYSSILDYVTAVSPVQGFVKAQGKSIPIQTVEAPEDSWRLRFSDFRQSAHEGGKGGSPTHRPPLLAKKYSWYPFLLETGSIPGRD